MKSIALVLVTGLLLAVGAVAVACGGGGGGKLTLEQYFQKIDEVQNNNDATLATKEASASTPSPDASGEELSTFLTDSLAEFATTLRGTASKADDIKPPAEVASAHNEIVDAINGAADAMDKVSDTIPASITLDQFQNANQVFFSGEEVGVAFERFTTACVALEQIAVDNDITVDLGCSA